MLKKMVKAYDPEVFVVYTRSGGKDLGPFEKPVILPALENTDPTVHAWAEARFAIDIMAEHALFFMQLMPLDVAKKEHAEALRFYTLFLELFAQIDKSHPPAKSELKSFTTNVIEQIQPFVEYKSRMREAQVSGKLRSLVWPLFFHHTEEEAIRWIRRLKKLGDGRWELQREEVVKFGTDIMEEHSRFTAHLLDPDEEELIKEAMKTSSVFEHLEEGGVPSAIIHDPLTVMDSMIKNPETDAILSAAETILDFKTKMARDIEAARIKSIIDPRLADHVRREAVKFIDELKRAV